MCSLIIIFDKHNSNLMFFNTLAAAKSYTQAFIEPPDVDFYQIFDVEGRIFHPVAKKDCIFSPRFVNLIASNERDIEGLRQILLTKIPDANMSNINENIETIIQLLFQKYSYDFYSMCSPIIIFDKHNSNLMFFNTLADAQVYTQAFIEPSDVDLYQVFDAEGRVFHPVVRKYSLFSPRFVVLTASNMQDIEGLRQILLSKIPDATMSNIDEATKTIIQKLFQKHGYSIYSVCLPIIVFCTDDCTMMFYKTLADAQSAIEPPDIKLYQIFDAEGRVFYPKIIKIQRGRFAGNLIVRLEASNEINVEDLRQILLSRVTNKDTLSKDENISVTTQRLLQEYGYGKDI